MIKHHEGKGWLLIDDPIVREARRDARGQSQWFQWLQALYLLRRGRISGRSPAEVARRAGIDADTLTATVDAYNRSDADPAGKPAEFVRPLLTPPFSLVDVSIKPSLGYPCAMLTLGGLAVDESTGRVRGLDGRPISGLYAAGRSAVGICSRSYVSGLSLTDCVFSGRRAGLNSALAQGLLDKNENVFYSWHEFRGRKQGMGQLMRGADSPQAAREVIAGVRDLLPTLRERAQDTEDARRIPDESIKSLQETGFFKLLQPKPYGGYESTPVTFYTAVKLIASAWGSTGWVASILGAHPWHVALFDAQAQEDVWSEDVDVRISSSYAPMGTAQIVDGGCRLTGKWSFSSGCDHATWILLCVRRVRQAGGLLHLPAADQRLHHRRRLGHRGTSWYR
jgi:hypothetical protein